LTSGITSNSRETPPPLVIADRYTVEKVLGRGGMATVYLCLDSKTSSKVAVKVLREELGSAVVVERFLREIEFASELDHPRIPKVLDSGITGAVPFYVMTYVEGESLRQRLDREKQLPIDEAVRIALAVMEPMTYAHASGLVHRDIKPGNILLGDDSVYVLDFGIARALIASADERLTSTGVAVGTPAYMSPEQALADGHLDARSDIYSLGCVMYEMIAGIPPFVGATPQAVMARRFGSPPPPLGETREGIEPHVQNAVAKALCRAPADRWQTAEDFARGLTHPTASESETTAERKVHIRRRARTRGVAVGLAAIVIAGLYLATTLRRDPIDRSTRDLIEWDFASARSELLKAAEEKPNDPRLQLWLAQLLMLDGTPRDEWRPFALRAAMDSGALTARERPMAAALVDYSSEQSQAPCAGFDLLSRSPGQTEAIQLTSTLSLAKCLAGDRKIVPDASSPSGYRFRSSANRAASLYEDLILRHSGNPASYAFLMPRLEEILTTDKNKSRRGVLSGETDRIFLAWPSLEADTLVHVPLPLGGDGAVKQNSSSVSRAVERNIRKLMELATSWTEARQSDPAAHETLARMLEAGGRLDGVSPSALEEIRLARNLVKGGDLSGDTYVRRLSLASTNVRLLLKAQRFDAAGLLADSALSMESRAKLSDSLQNIANDLTMGLSALRGRVGKVVDINQRYVTSYPLRLESGEMKVLPAEVATDAANLSTYAAFGAPRDSIISVAARLSSKLSAVVPETQLREIRSAVMGQPLAWAAPVIGLEPAAQLGPTGDSFGNAVRALHQGDVRSAKRYSDSIAALHADFAPGEVTMDAVFRRAWLRDAIGDTPGAIAIAENALSGLSRTPPGLLANYRLPAALVRVMILRSQLAKSVGDQSSAARWAAAARSLWGKGDRDIVATLEQN
jgi:serine/threonine protein kinase